MKKKHRFQQFLNSVVKSHGDIEEDRKEIENNVKKMMEIFENKGADVSDRYDFIALGNDIKKTLYDLYERHDILIGKIKDKVHHRKGLSSSESSDSGSEDSSDVNGPNKVQEQKIMKQLPLDGSQSFKEQIDSLSKRNAELEAQSTSMQAKLEEIHHQACELNDELRTMQNELKRSDVENVSFKEEIEKLKVQEGKLHLQLGSLQKENEILMAEKEKVSCILLQTDNYIVELKSELENMIVDTGELRECKNFLNEELEEKTHELVHLNQQIASTREERETLRVALGEIKSANVSLTYENGSLLFENQDLKAREETAIQEVSNLKIKLLVMVEENDGLKSEVLTLSTGMHEADKIMKDMSVESEHLKEDISKLHDTMTDLTYLLKIKDDENNVLTLKSLEFSNIFQQAEERITVLSEEAERMKTENSMLLAGHASLALELEGKDQELLKLKEALETTELEANALRVGNNLLSTEQENMKLELEGHNQKLSKLNRDLEAMEFQRNSLTEEKSDLLSKINEGGIVINDLRSKIEEIEKEKSQLQWKTSNLEVEIQYANLKFTDAKNALAEMELERNSLVEEKSCLFNKINEHGMVIDNLKAQIEEVEGEKSQLQLKISNLDLEIQSANVQFSDVKNALVESESQTNSLIEEKSGIFSKINEGEVAINALNAQIKEVEGEKSQLQLKISTLVNEIQSTNLQFSDLKNTLTTIELERDSLAKENSILLNKLDEVGSIIDAFKSQVETLESEKSQLQQKISNLELEFQSANLLFIDVKNALVAAQEENKILVSKNSLVESKLKETYMLKEVMQTELCELNQKNSILLSMIEEAEKVTNGFKVERDGLIADNLQLEAKVDVFMKELESTNIQLNQFEGLIRIAEEEKMNFLSEISMLTDKLQLTETDNEKLAKEIGMLIDENTAFPQYLEELRRNMVDHNRMTDATSAEIQDLRSKLELAQKEILHDIQTWIDSFKGDLLQICTAKVVLDQELKCMASISSENQLSLKKMEDGLRCKISDHDALLQKYEELLTEQKQMEGNYSESCAKLEIAKNMIEQLKMKEEGIQRLDRICAEQKNDIIKLGENYRELLEKFSSNEVGKGDAEREIQRLEVQIRLSNQKLKVTETEYKEKEENWKRLVDQFKEELRLLEGQVLMRSTMSAELNNECKQIKFVLDTSIITSARDIEELESHALDNMSSIKKQLTECLLELEKVKTCLEAELHEKRKLKNENHKLSVKMSDREGIILKLKDEASKGLAKLAEKENELKILKRRVVESEKNLKEKEREGLDKDEEKREAIRQLCLLIEYHWENHNHLVRYLTSLHRNDGTS